MTENPHQKYLSQLEPCPSCGGEDLSWCNVSVRPLCNECDTWGYVNNYPDGPYAAIKSWNERSRKATKQYEREWQWKELEKYNKELGVDLTIKDLVSFHRANCSLL